MLSQQVPFPAHETWTKHFMENRLLQKLLDAFPVSPVPPACRLPQAALQAVAIPLLAAISKLAEEMKAAY